MNTNHADFVSATHIDISFYISGLGMILANLFLRFASVLFAGRATSVG